jgi:hypothetical protein
MSRYRKPLLWAGCALLLAFGGLMGYASFAEEQIRNQYKAPVEMDYGFIPVDLLEGRTEYKSLDQRKSVLKLTAGPQVEGRILMARVACGLGALGLVLLAVRAFVKEK